MRITPGKARELGWLRCGGNQSIVRPSAKPIDRRRVYSGIDRTGHQDHRARAATSAHGFEQSHGGEDPDGRLADRHHMHVSSEKSQKLSDNSRYRRRGRKTLRPRYEAGIVPVREIDLVWGRRSRTVPRRRWRNGRPWAPRPAPWGHCGASPPLEIDENPQNGFGDDDALANGDLAALPRFSSMPPGRLPVAPRGALEQFGAAAALRPRGVVVGGIERLRNRRLGVGRGPAGLKAAWFEL